MDGRDSPCIALCSTALGDPVCRGCGRTFDEVAAWCTLHEDGKRQIWQRLPQRLRLIEIGLSLGLLIDIEADCAGREWARIVGGGAAAFRLYRGVAGLRLAWRGESGTEEELVLPAGAVSSAQAYAELLRSRLQMARPG